MTTQEKTMIRDVAELLKALKPHIDDEFRATDDPDDDQPGMQVTIASDDGETWGYQTGDNSYTGDCYSYANWGVGYLYRRSNSLDVATEMVGQVFEGIAQMAE